MELAIFGVVWILYGTVIKEMINDLCVKAQGIPLPERLAPRHTKTGNLDLTASTLFVQDAETHARLAHVLNPSNVLVPFRGAQINVGSALQMLLSTLRALHQFWRQKPILTPNERQKYLQLTTQFGELWRASGWRVSTWVHWVVRHSGMGAIDKIKPMACFTRPKI